MDCSPPGASVHGILQARILEGVAIPPPGELPNPGIEPSSPALQADSLLLSHLGSAGDALTMSKRTTDLQTLWTEHIKPRSSRLSPRLRFSLRLPPSLSLALTSPLFLSAGSGMC